MSKNDPKIFTNPYSVPQLELQMFTNASNTTIHSGSFTNVEGSINNYNIQGSHLEAALTQFRKLLSPVGCDAKHKKACAVTRTRPDAGHWLLEMNEYKEWKSGCSSSRLLWLCGIPGAGKTVLSSVAIEDVRKMPDATVIFFYCEFQDPTKHDPTTVLATLLDQLLRQLPITSLTLEGMLQCLANRRSVHELDMESLILTFAEEFERVFVFIDGLDECELEELEELLPQLTNIASRLSMFVASRDQPEIRLEFERRLKLTIRPDHIEADLRQFANADVKRISIGDASLTNEVVETLVRGSGGTFLWPVYHMQQLRKLRTDYDIRIALESLPPGIDKTLVRALELIDAKPNAHRLRMVLMLVCCATTPLTLPQLVEGVAVEEMNGSWDSSRVVNDMMSLVDDCANLLICVPSGYGPELYIVQPFHACVKEFLLSYPGRMTGSLAKYSLHPASQTHVHLAKLCLSYLNLRPFQDLTRAVVSSSQCTKISQYPFACYAVQAWLSHIRASGTAELANQFHDFLSPDGSTLRKWQDLYEGLVSTQTVHRQKRREVLNNQEVHGFTPVHIAVWFNLPMMVRHYGIDEIKKKDASGITALHLAVKRGSSSLVGCLLECGADIWEVDGAGNTPLHLATGRPGYQRLPNATMILQQLLNAQGVVEMKNREGRTCLHLAAERANDSFVPLLLQHGANGNAIDNCSCTPLHLAARGSEYLLLRQVIKPEHLTELQVELALTYQKVMSVLLERGAKLEAVDHKKRTPLHTAASKGLGFAVEVLLCHGASVDAVDEDLRTPLHLATTCKVLEVFPYQEIPVQVFIGSESTVMCLLKWRANINAVDKHEWTPLHLALSHGQACRLSVLALLLDCGADVNAIGPNGWTPLHLAASTAPFREHLVKRHRPSISWVACREVVASLLAHEVGNKHNTSQKVAEQIIAYLKSRGVGILAAAAKDEAKPLHPSALWFCEVLTLTRSKGARLDVRDCEGQSVLPHALIYWASWLKESQRAVKAGSTADEDKLHTAYHEWTAILNMLLDHAGRFN